MPRITLLFVFLFLVMGRSDVVWSLDRTRPNIVVILVDDMGYGDAGCYNPESKIPTPHIDSLAEQGMRFTDAHAPGPLCHMSRYGLMTGRYPFRTDVSKWRDRGLIRPGETTLASHLNSIGYRTAMVGKWHLGFNESGYDQALPGGPVDVGFDQFFGIRASTDIPPYFYIRDRRAVAPPTDRIEAHSTPGWSPIQGEFWRGGGIAPGLRLSEVLPRLTEEATGVIEDHRASDDDRPLMLYVAFPAPHTPWLPAERFRGASGAGMYGDFMTMVDAMVGKVLSQLDSARMRENTLVIFSSDNGPVWYDRDVQRFGHDSSGGLRGMKGDAWECGHRMPFLVRWPGVVRPASVSDQLVCFTDLLATFAAITETQLPAGGGPDSIDFSSALREEASTSGSVPPRSELLMRSARGVMTVRQGRWKWIDGLGSGGFSSPPRAAPRDGGPTTQLYDLAGDPGERQNLALKHSEVVRRLRNLVPSKHATSERLKPGQKP